MRFTWGVIVGLAIQGGLSQTSVPSEGELTLRQDTGVPDTEVPPTDAVQPPVVSDTPPVETGPADSPAADPTPTDVAPPQVTESEAPGSNTEPAGDASSVGTVPLETPFETIPATVPEATPAQTQTGEELTPETPAGTEAGPPPPSGTEAVAPSNTPATAGAQGGGETTEAATGAADETQAADNTAVASETQAAGQTATRGEEPTTFVNSAVPSAVPSAISSAIESAITSAIRSAEEASTFAEEASTVAGVVTTVAEVVTTIGDVVTTIEGERTVTNKAPASDGPRGTTLTTRAAATSTVSVPVSLQSASVGDNAVVKQVDGKPAVVLSPPAGGQASFEVTAAKPQAVKEKDLVRVKANVTLTESTGGTGQAKDDPCNVKMDVNGKSVYNKDLSATTEGPFEITSDFFEAASGDQDIKFTQKCGQNPQQMTVNGMSLQGQVRAESGSGDGGSGGSGGSETSSADGSKSTGKDNASSSNKPAMFALGLFAALAVLVM